MARHALIPAAHLFLIKDGRILLLRRHNTGYEDGNYSVIAGHVEQGETPTDTILREAQEEGGVVLSREHLSMQHVMHWLGRDERISFFFFAERWVGEPRNLEPDKCSELAWFPLDALPGNTIPYIRSALRSWMEKTAYSEFDDRSGKDAQ